MRFRDMLLGLFVALIWGGNFTATKIGLDYIPAYLFLTIRYLICTIILIPYFKKMTVRFKDLYIMGVVTSVFQNGFLFSGVERGVNVSAAVIANQSNVPVSTILSYVLYKEKITKKLVFGIITAFIGIIIVFGKPNFSGDGMAILQVLIGGISLSILTLYTKKCGQFKVMPFLAWTSLISLPHLFLISLAIEDINLDMIYNLNKIAIICILYTVFAVIGGFGLWFYLLQKYPVTMVVPYTLLIPVFGIVIAYFVLGEKLDTEDFIGAFLVIIGVAVVILKNPFKIIKKLYSNATVSIR